MWLGVATAVFMLVRMSGDPAIAILGDKASPEEIARFRERTGLDRPLGRQYVDFLGDLATGDLGRNYHANREVRDQLTEVFPATIELAVVAMTLAIVLGMALGTVAAVYRNRWPDGVSMVAALVGVSVPIFWLALLAMKGLGEDLSWFPVGGRLSPVREFRPLTGMFTLDALLRGDFAAFRDAIAHLVLPAVVLSTVPAAIITRMTRSAVVEVLGRDHVRTARSKGLPELRVVIRHGLRNALVPVMTVVGLQFGLLLGGAVLTETIFGWPGLGKYTFDSVMRREFHAVQSSLLLMATVFLVANLVVDVLYGFLDPRIREGLEDLR